MINKYKKTIVILLVALLVLSVVALLFNRQEKEVLIDSVPLISISFDIEEKDNLLKVLEREEKTEQSLEVLSIEEPELLNAKIAINNGINKFFDYHITSTSNRDTVVRKIDLSRSTIEENNKTISLYEDIRYTNFAYLKKDNVYDLYIFSSSATKDSVNLLVNGTEYAAIEEKEGIYFLPNVVLTGTDLIAISGLENFTIDRAYIYLENFVGKKNYSRIVGANSDNVLLKSGEITVSNLSDQYVVFESDSKTVIRPKAMNYENEVTNFKFFKYKVIGGIKSFDSTSFSNVFVVYQNGEYNYSSHALNKKLVVFVLFVVILILLVNLSVIVTWIDQAREVSGNLINNTFVFIKGRSGEILLYISILMLAMMLKFTSRFGDLFPATYLFALAVLFIVILTRFKYTTIAVFMIILIPIIAISEVLSFQTMSEKSAIIFYILLIILIAILLIKNIVKDKIAKRK